MDHLRPLQLALTIHRDDLQGVRDQLSSSSEFVEVKSDAFSADVDTITFVTGLTSATIGAIATIITQAIRTKNGIRVRCNGIEVDGLTKGDAKGVLRELLDRESDGRR